MIIFSLVFVYFCGVLDRLRGSKNHGFVKTVDASIMGTILAVLLNLDMVWWLPFFSLFALGMSYGYGDPWGDVLHNKQREGNEWWQVGGLKYDATVSLFVRGTMLGLTVLPLVYVNHHVVWFSVLCVFSFYLPARIGNMLSRENDWSAWLPPIEKGIWDKAECIRGWYLGMCAFLVGLVSVGGW